jgi:hypothetical protein
MPSISDLVEQIQAFEIRHKLYDNSLLSKVWKSNRTGLYYALQKDMGVFSDVKPRSSIVGKFFALVKVVVNSSFNMPRINDDCTSIIMQHPRTKKSGLFKIDPYIYSYTRNLAASSLFLSRTSIGEKSKVLSENSASLDYILIKKLLNFKSLKKVNYDSIHILVESLNIEFSINSNKYLHFFLKKSKDYLIEESSYYKLLHLTNVNTLYLVDGYSKNVPLVSACKKLGIKVIEYQHGIISKFHLGYSVKQPDLNWPCYPDDFLAWGPQWINGAVLPSSINVSYITPTYLNNRVMLPKLNQLMVVSQSVLGLKIAQFLLNNIDISRFESVIFKLHPGEADLFLFYSNFFEGFNVEVSIQDCYELLNQSKYVIGVFSTVMLEALDYDCHVSYMNLPGSEYIKNTDGITDCSNEVFYIAK